MGFRISAELRKARAVQTTLAATCSVTLFQVWADHFAPDWNPIGVLQVVPGWLPRGEVWRPLTANLVHELGIVHLLLNMIGLVLAGPAVEAALGARGFLALYSICGYAAWAASAWRGNSGSGASAALTGIFGALLVLALRPSDTPSTQRSLLLRAIILSAVWLLSGPVLDGLIVPGLGVIEIANDAHVAGFATGIVLTCLMEMFWNRAGFTGASLGKQTC